MCDSRISRGNGGFNIRWVRLPSDRLFVPMKFVIFGGCRKLSQKISMIFRFVLETEKKAGRGWTPWMTFYI